MADKDPKGVPEAGGTEPALAASRAPGLWADTWRRLRRSRLAVVADTLSLPGALPLAMGIPFGLLRTSYTPSWCAAFVERHPRGMVLDDLTALPVWVERLLLE